MSDLISKKELLERIAAYEEETGDELGCVYNIVEKMPTMDLVVPIAYVAQKVGHWELTHDYDHLQDAMIPMGRVVRCSVCGYPENRLASEYCPNCGARMEGNNGRFNQPQGGNRGD